MFLLNPVILSGSRYELKRHTCDHRWRSCNFDSVPLKQETGKFVSLGNTRRLFFLSWVFLNLSLKVKIFFSLYFKTFLFTAV